MTAASGITCHNGRNVRIAFRWAGGDPDHSLFYAGELVGMKPDVILVNNALVVPLLQKETHIIPIVFVAIADPVVAGIVTSLAQPGGNITGFTIGEYAIGGKRLEVLKEVAPDVARVTVILDPRQPAQVGAARAIEAAGPSFRVDVTMAVDRQPLGGMAGLCESTKDLPPKEQASRLREYFGIVGGA